MKPELQDDIELRLKGHLYELRETNDAVLDGRQGYPVAERGYERTLREVTECATTSELDEVAEYIKEYLRQEQERPPNRKVRRVARKKISEAGYPPSPYLNRA